MSGSGPDYRLSLSKRLAAELIARGFAATSVADLGLLGRPDDVVLRTLGARSDLWVLVTSDDEMPHEHETLVRNISATIATIDGQWEQVCQRHNLTRTQEEFQTRYGPPLGARHGCSRTRVGAALFANFSWLVDTESTIETVLNTRYRSRPPAGAHPYVLARLIARRSAVDVPPHTPTSSCQSCST